MVRWNLTEIIILIREKYSHRLSRQFGSSFHYFYIMIVFCKVKSKSKMHLIKVLCFKLSLTSLRCLYSLAHFTLYFPLSVVRLNLPPSSLQSLPRQKYTKYSTINTKSIDTINQYLKNSNFLFCKTKIFDVNL